MTPPLLRGLTNAALPAGLLWLLIAWAVAGCGQAWCSATPCMYPLTCEAVVEGTKDGLPWWRCTCEEPTP